MKKIVFILWILPMITFAQGSIKYTKTNAVIAGKYHNKDTVSLQQLASIPMLLLTVDSASVTSFVVASKSGDSYLEHSCPGSLIPKDLITDLQRHDIGTTLFIKEIIYEKNGNQYYAKSMQLFLKK